MKVTLYCCAVKWPGPDGKVVVMSSQNKETLTRSVRYYYRDQDVQRSSAKEITFTFTQKKKNKRISHKIVMSDV